MIKYFFIIVACFYQISFSMNSHVFLNLDKLHTVSKDKIQELKKIESKLLNIKKEIESTYSIKIPNNCIICIALICDQKEYIKQYFTKFPKLLNQSQFHGDFDKNTLSLTSYQTPLTLSCASYSINTVKKLIKLGANVNKNDQSYYATTPLIAACKCDPSINNANRYKVIELLIEKKAQLDSKDDLSYTALDYIVKLNIESKTITVDILAFYLLTKCAFDQELAQAYGTFAKYNRYKVSYSDFYKLHPELHVPFNKK